MGRRPKWGRPVNGVLLLNKDCGMTSNTALQKAKRLFFAKRAGHTGSLDPLASGVLPICFGESTKFSQYLLDADKRYLSTFRLGVKTETSDCDGAIVSEVCASHITQEKVEACLPEFRGLIKQTPSIYSALKFQGKPLYQWAREGIEIPPEGRKEREITVYDYQLLAFRSAADCNSDYPEIDVSVHCSKGTYIRTLSEDLGERLGVGAHVIRLHREAAGPFTMSKAISLAELESIRADGEPDSLDSHLLPIDSPIALLPKIEVTSDMGHYFNQGQAIMSTEAYRSASEGDMVRVCDDSGRFLGAALLKDGNIEPKRVVNYEI